MSVIEFNGEVFTKTKMSGSPLVSIILPFLNAEKFIQETIESVLAQTYKTWELLLVDDGSTDASTNIAHRIAQQYPQKVRYLEHPGHQNRGLSTSRNLGARQAKGEYIAPLDADDIWLPQKLARQVAILQAYPDAAMTYGPGQWWYSWTGEPGDRERDYLQTLHVPSNTLCQPPTLLTRYLRQPTAVPPPFACAVRRAVIERIGGWEEAVPDVYEDQAFYAKVCLVAPVFVESECYCKYRKHPNSLCAAMKKTGQYPVVRQIFLNWLEVYMSRQQVQNGEVWAALHKELWPYRHPALRRISKYGKSRINQIKAFLKLCAQWILPVHIHQWLKPRLQRQVG